MLGLREKEIQQGTRETKQKVQDRVELFQDYNGQKSNRLQRVIVVDDGLASGYTTRSALQAIRYLGVGELILAIPTAPAKRLCQICTQL